MRLITVVVAFGLLSSLSGCRTSKPDAGEPCSSEEDGDSGGCKKGLWCFHGDDRPPRCLTDEETHAACRKTKRCTEGGGCSYHPGLANCVAKREEDCKQSQVCKNDGKCRLDERMHACVK